MFTGEGNPYNLSRINKFNGEEHLKFWKEDRCNIVRGSDGATFNPYIAKVRQNNEVKTPLKYCKMLNPI